MIVDSAVIAADIVSYGAVEWSDYYRTLGVTRNDRHL